jgi:D-tyrosyl-tRNA(Tyr) deacylase
VIGLLQRVSSASVTVDGRVVGQIVRGLLVLVGVQPDDGDAQAERLLERLLGYRVFEDEAGRMNRNVREVGGGLLLVPQFTLAADTGRGMRPSFTSAAAPELGQRLFERLVETARSQYGPVESGVFGAHMAVSLVNDGPVTFWLEVRAPAAHKQTSAM